MPDQLDEDDDLGDLYDPSLAAGGEDDDAIVLEAPEGPDDPAMAEGPRYSNRQLLAFARRTEKRVDKLRVQYGRKILVPATGAVVGGAKTPVLDHESSWEVAVACSTPHPGTYLLATVIYGTGEITTTRAMLVTGVTPNRIPIGSARSCEIALQWVTLGVSMAPGAALEVQTSIGDGARNLSPLDWFAPSFPFENTLIAVSDTGTLDEGPGTILVVEANVIAVPSGPCYLGLFDVSPSVVAASAGYPPAGTAPITMGPLVNGPGAYIVFNDETSPSHRYTNGLVWALTAGPSLYAPVPGGGLVRVEYKRGD